VILADHQIRELCQREAMVTPYDESLLNPASLDVRLGRLILVEAEHTEKLQPIDMSHHTETDPYWLAPGEFVLAETQETFNLPEDVAAQFILKSSRGREGYSHALCGYCDPGWHGSKLTLELHSLRRFHSLPLYPGMKIGQIVFCLMSDQPERSYAVTGRYNQDRCVTTSKG